MSLKQHTAERIKTYIWLKFWLATDNVIADGVADEFDGRDQLGQGVSKIDADRLTFCQKIKQIQVNNIFWQKWKISTGQMGIIQVNNNFWQKI